MNAVNVTLEDVLVKNTSIVSRRIAGEAVLVPIRKNVADLDSIYTLNDSGAAIWEHIDGSRSLRQVLASLVEEFEVEEDQARQDMLELVVELVSIGALEKR